ncbi:MAG: GNAT family N-acetyltransferase [Desulfovibrio sp.]|nr:GNAT family N-acetyltransferase [Desulfovibrio sp.]
MPAKTGTRSGAARPRNLLEPAAFAGLFRACPPEGFVLSPCSDLCVFRTKYDLLTTAAGDIPALLRRPAGFARRLGLFRVQAAFVGSTVTEYAVLPRAYGPEDILDAVLRERDGNDSITVIKDLPDASPLQDAEDNAFADALVRAARARGFFTLCGQALAYVPIDFSSTDEYLSRLSASRRKDLRRKLKRGPPPEPEIIACGDPRCSDPAFVDEIYTLYRAVFDRSEVHFDLLSRAFFANLLQSRDAGALLFLYRHKGETVGWNLCLAHNGLLIDKYIGFRYPAARDLNLYFLSWLFNLEYAVNNGFKTYIAGWTDPEVKAGLGASFTFTRHSVLVHNPLLRAVLYPLRRFFEADRATFARSVKPHAENNA